jgi:microsomal dipeptidase-like Zn-dependent dipeptidase
MFSDLHCHYPMHLLAKAPKEPPPGEVTVSSKVTEETIAELSKRPRWLEELRAGVFRVAADWLNFRDREWRVDLDGLEDAEVRAVFSVLYQPFAEIDLDELPGSDPEQGYFGDLTGQLDAVEKELGEIDSEGARHAIVKSAADLDATVAAGKVAFMHCVEGGFHLGGDAAEIDARVAELAERGVVYITLAHLFYRGVATNAPALPFMSDSAYDTVFDQPEEYGLSPLGIAAVTAMHKHRVLIDVSHMNQRALDDTFALVEELDAGADPHLFPVIATHGGYRFGEQSYMLTPPTIGKIAARDGVVGLILARHQLNDGLEDEIGDPDDPASTPKTLCRHIDAIRACTPGKTNTHVGIGSDLDGFIKPTVAGIERASDLDALRAPLETAYPEDAAKIMSGNALRVARRILEQRG